MNIPIGKTCTTCNEIKPASLEFFHKHKGGKEGLCAVCKPCINIASKSRYEVNREKIAARNKKWKLANPEKNAATHKKWRLENPEKRASYIKNWTLENRERKASTDKNWQNKNPDKVSAINRNYRARKAKAEGSHTAEDVANIIAKQNKFCFWCNTELEKIHIDHIIPLIKGGRNDASNLVASCPSCNCSKGAKLPEEFLAYKQQQIK